MRSTQIVQLNPDICQACQRCSALRVCRMKAIIQIDPGEQPYLDAERCRDCRYCIPACPYGAIQKYPPQEAGLLASNLPGTL